MDHSGTEPSGPSVARKILLVTLCLAGLLLLLDVALYLNATATKGDAARSCTVEAIAPRYPELGRGDSVKRCVRRNVRAGLKDLAGGVGSFFSSHPGACRYVGTWYSWRRGDVHIIDMQKSGIYKASHLSAPNGVVDTGTWRYANGHIHWTHQDIFAYPSDVNEVVDEVSEGFTLIEVNKDITVFRALGGQLEKCQITQ